ncbi:hypothetical protein C3F09_07880 [candidate division GN15 bacterium]|uniref:Cytochrome c-552/DMSO reductase-like haem-binding domain-containing protein n=1 Tax=candidate division GN15 bacterium TaxID=2072418 RepID=A0A855X672_9BACT|nr:MAG: hypothetical protein C3F09_07880 [candidate division GN15 bacterium]
MRHSLLIAGLLVTALLLFGCGSDKPSEPVTPKPQRIVVTQGTAAPSMDNPEATVWNGITPTAVDLSTTLAPTPAVAGVTAIADSVYVQALTFHDTLYLRVRWADNSHSVWRGAYTVRDTSDSLAGQPVTYFNAPDSVGRQEDQLWVLFAGLASGDWDGLNWRALTTDSTFLAEGINLHRATTSDPWDQVKDEGTLEVYRANKDLINAGYPAYFHEDTSSYHGYTLFENDNLRTLDFFIRGWDLGQTVPYYILDSTKFRLPAATRGSRWDTRTISDYAPLGAERPEYTVVLCRPMNTGYTDDVVLTDSVKTKIGVFDNQMDINVGGTGRGFTKEFWLIF